MYKKEKEIILNFFESIENCPKNELESVFNKFVSDDYVFRGVYPFREQNSAQNAIESFYKPFFNSVKNIQRRQDIFIAGTNEISEETWVMSMGHFMGLFDEEWLGMRPTNKIVNLRYAEFNCIVDDKITQTGLFVDLIGFMNQVGLNPLPISTGQYYIYPGPRNHDGLLFDDTDLVEGEYTLNLVNKMVNDLSELNESGAMGCPPEVLQKSWSDNMIWYGPAGIGASYTIPRYQLQHQLPFRNNLDGKTFNGHVCRFAEGNFACFFGWPNLTNTPLGGFLGLPGGNISADMQVVDIYRREGDKLVENWVFIDIPYWLKQQGVDIIKRTAEISNPK